MKANATQKLRDPLQRGRALLDAKAIHPVAVRATTFARSRVEPHSFRASNECSSLRDQFRGRIRRSATTPLG